MPHTPCIGSPTARNNHQTRASRASPPPRGEGPGVGGVATDETLSVLKQTRQGRPSPTLRAFTPHAPLEDIERRAKPWILLKRPPQSTPRPESSGESAPGERLPLLRHWSERQWRHRPTGLALCLRRTPPQTSYGIGAIKCPSKPSQRQPPVRRPPGAYGSSTSRASPPPCGEGMGVGADRRASEMPCVAEWPRQMRRSQSPSPSEAASCPLSPETTRPIAADIRHARTS